MPAAVALNELAQVLRFCIERPEHGRQYCCMLAPFLLLHYLFAMKGVSIGIPAPWKFLQKCATALQLRLVIIRGEGLCSVDVLRACLTASAHFSVKNVFMVHGNLDVIDDAFLRRVGPILVSLCRVTPDLEAADTTVSFAGKVEVSESSDIFRHSMLLIGARVDAENRRW